MAREMDAIVHNGAFVHWLLPYEKLRDTNVRGTQEVFRLATASRLKSVHHVSTTSVLESAPLQKKSVVLEVRKPEARREPKRGKEKKRSE